jgi:hypothetical protein
VVECRASGAVVVRRARGTTGRVVVRVAITDGTEVVVGT